jgi:hypothetical protein
VPLEQFIGLANRIDELIQFVDSASNAEDMAVVIEQALRYLALVWPNCIDSLESALALLGLLVTLLLDVLGFVLSVATSSFAWFSGAMPGWVVLLYLSGTCGVGVVMTFVESFAQTSGSFINPFIYTYERRSAVPEEQPACRTCRETVSVNIPNTWRNHLQQMVIGIAEVEGFTSVVPSFPRLDCNF